VKRNLLRLIVSVLLLGLLFTFVVDVRQVWHSVRQVQLEYLFAALVVTGLDRFMMTYKWLLLLRPVNHVLTLTRAMAIYCTATLIGTVLPVTVGGDVIRGVLTTRAGVRGDHVIASIIVERMLGFLCVMLLGVFSLLVLRGTHLLSAKYNPVLLLGMVVFCVAATIAICSFSTRALKWVSALPHPIRDSQLAKRLEKLWTAYHQLGAHRETLGSFSALTLLEQFLPGLTSWLLLKGMGVEVNPVLLFCALLLSVLAARLPISIDGLGIFEGVLAAFLGLAGVRPEYSVATALTGRALQIVVCLPWWFAFTRQSGPLRIGSLSELTPKPAKSRRQ
jgi:uncharacterized protein (TIRG00374 family)